MFSHTLITQVLNKSINHSIFIVFLIVKSMIFIELHLPLYEKENTYLNRRIPNFFIDFVTYSKLVLSSKLVALRF